MTQEHEDCVPWSNDCFTVDWDHVIWICYKCGKMFNSEICNSFTGECYECYPREMKQ